MKSQKRDVLIATALVLLLAGAALGYRTLSNRYEPDTVPQESFPVPDEASVTDAAAPELPAAANFTVDDGDGNEIQLAEFIGEPIIVNFWASWCPPCRAELPDFEVAYQEHGTQIRFLMIDLTDGVQETHAAVDALIAENGYTFPVYYDTTGSAVSAYQLYSIPKTVAINADGRIVRTQLGALNEETLAELIALLI